MEFTAFLFGNINEEGELENEDLLGRVSDVEIGGFKDFTVTFLQNEVAQLGRMGVVDNVVGNVKEEGTDKEDDDDDGEI